MTGMVFADIDRLTDEERAVRDAAHRFAADVLRPAGAALDRLPDPAQVIAQDSVLWDVFAQYRRLGLDVLEGPGAELPMLQQARLRFLVCEELGWGDAGLAISLGVAGFHRLFATLSPDPAVVARFGAPGGHDIGCWAITEPDHGSDQLQPGGDGAGGASRPNCVARRDGDHWVIDGQKAAWVSNGTIATVATLFCAIDEGHGPRAGGVCLVPLDLPGVSRGKPLDKLGQRALNQGEIFFDGVRVPAGHMVVGPDGYAATLEMVLAIANASMGAIFVGLARAAAEQAIAYAKERVQGGVPIFQHQSVRARLFRLFAQVESARSLAWRVMLHNAVNPPRVEYSIASKVVGTTAAFEVASGAVQIFGGNGLSREYPIEKLLRDARASMIEDGCNDLLSLVGGGRL